MNDLYFDNFGQIGKKLFAFKVSIAEKFMEKLGDRNQKDLALSHKFFAGLSKLHSNYPEELFGIKNFSKKNNEFFGKIGKKKFRTLSKNVSAGLSKLLFNCPDERFG